MPAIIDSRGNPGTGGSAIGAVTETELRVSACVVVGVVKTVVTIEVVTTAVGCATVVVELCVVPILVELVV